jgi:hypothetical protein
MKEVNIKSSEAAEKRMQGICACIYFIYLITKIECVSESRRGLTTTLTQVTSRNFNLYRTCILSHCLDALSFFIKTSI